jgi:hypothetical protein
VKAVAVDDRRLTNSGVDGVEIDLCREASDRCGDLGDGCESSNVYYFGSSEQQNWPTLLADFS